MPNNIDNALRAAIRSMNEVIVPSLDPADPLAREQSALILQLLDFLRVRVPYVQQRDRAEVAIYHNLAAQLMHELAALLPDQLERVRDILAEAERVVADPVPAPHDLSRLADNLRTVLSDLVRASAEAPEPLRQKVESTVVRGSKPILDLQRSWFLPTGMVPRDSTLPELGDLLKVSAAVQRH